MSARLAVFDCDGTLVDGQGTICESMEFAFAQARLPAPDRHAIRRIVGLSLPQALRLLAPDASDDQHSIALDAYKNAFRTAREEGRLSETLFEGIIPLLENLHNDGWLLGVATGKSDRGLNATLEANGLTHLFVTLQTADRHPSKPDPTMLHAALDEAGVGPQQAVMIGDTGYDIAMAEAAGVASIGVDWGYHRPEELLAAGAHKIARTPQEIGSFAKALIK